MSFKKCFSHFSSAPFILNLIAASRHVKIFPFCFDELILFLLISFIKAGDDAFKSRLKVNRVHLFHHLTLAE